MNLSFATATTDDALAIAMLRNAATESLTRRYGEGSWTSLATEQAVVRDLSRPQFQRTLIARDGPDVVATLCLQRKKPWAFDVTHISARLKRRCT